MVSSCERGSVDEKKHARCVNYAIPMPAKVGPKRDQSLTRAGIISAAMRQLAVPVCDENMSVAAMQPPSSGLQIAASMMIVFELLDRRLRVR